MPQSYKYLNFLYIFLYVNLLFAQKPANELRKISHTQFVKALTSTKDSVFVLKDAFIVFDSKIDSNFYYKSIDNSFIFPTTDSLIIDVQVELENVHFEHRYEDSGAALHHIRFKKPVAIENSTSLVFSNCVFENGLYMDVNIPLNNYIDYFEKVAENYGNDISINQSEIKGESIIDIGTIETFNAIFVTVSNSIIYKKPDLENSFYANNLRSFEFFNNKIIGKGAIHLFIDTTRETLLTYNDFGEASVLLSQAGISSASLNVISDNIYRKPIILGVENFSKTDIYRWNEWEDKVVSLHGYLEYLEKLYKKSALNSASMESMFNNDSILNTYASQYKFQIENSYKFEKRLLGSFYDSYKSQYDTDFANKVYITLKDLETQRYQYLNKIEPSFKTYFTWKINQLLKVLSAYGTSPSRTIIISIYVIFIFAFIYLFFPNSWDTINRNRLMKRLRFYTRYFRNKESMKEIYQEDMKQDLMSFEEFKVYMNKSQKETPSYFLWLAKPIYYFSSTNYKIISKLFDKTDVLKGKWVDLPKSKKIATSVFMGLWIFMLLCFDVIIKFINALTLSINTFTTLGFGEIPTKGFPRYLSIIQGFIGWFMLSIFSISLISQILN
ncbi:potassium channel family protein [Lutibacter sp. Hel_I_33_5]|uniref:potassium channel family protein n=1 Tax=Lutibacter sp. Hel_I_33_5 TaxID=1566289 RepID=UPI0011AAEE55|nr:potassium channel family protein [Lutibacter sp. Hel_I_33_5]